MQRGALSLSVMQVLFEVSPCFRFGHMAAILDAFNDDKRVHIKLILTLTENVNIHFVADTGARLVCLVKLPWTRLTGVVTLNQFNMPLGA